MEQARSGSLEAMDELVSRYHEIVFRVALGILRDEEGASDVAQEAFLKAFKGLRTFRGDASFKTWLLTITTNEARGLLRKAGRRKELPLESAGPVASVGPGPDEEVIRSEMAEEVDNLLSSLPEKQGQAVRLRVYEGLSYREIGEIIGSSEGAARVNYHHGIRRLRELLR